MKTLHIAIHRAKQFAPVAVRRMTYFAALMLATLGLAPPAQAAPVVLSDTGLNSSVTIDPTSQSGISSWVVDGVDHLYQQWFWLRIGSVGGEASLDTLVHNSLTDMIVANTNFTPGDDTLVARYYDPEPLSRFEVELRITLQAGAVGSNSASLTQQITVKNTSGAALPLRLFMFSDFDMNGTVDFDTVNITGGNTATQSDGETLIESQIVTTPAPWRYQADDRNDLLMLLNNATPTTLDNTATYAGPGDPAWAFQWNASIPDGGSFIISNSQSVQASFLVPEPATMGVALMGGLGLCGFAWRSRRHRRVAG
ncbi:MAG: PEP-CTERM sorting domain-containing protein [Pirellulales bacterium]|nr:PEP-CTERM sorting domain-containing protein [Pirellulales bacterium]